MNISEYRESGILQAYVLGVLDDERTDQLHLDLQTNVALQKELTEVEKSLSQFKRHFLRKKADYQTSGKKEKANSRGKKVSGGGQKLILAFLAVLIIGLVFLFLSTLYERAAYQTQLAESLELIKYQQSTIDDINLKTEALESSFSSLIEETGGPGLYSGIGQYDTINASLFEGNSGMQMLLYLSEIPVLRPEQIIQLWGRVGNEWRRAGMIRSDEVNNLTPPAFFLFPMGNVKPEMATVESQTAPSKPDMQNILFR